MVEHEFVCRCGDLSEAPDPKTVCSGQCEGMGYVPVGPFDKNDEEGPWHDLWLEAEAKKSSEDGYHFVVCPTCRGSGRIVN